IAQASDASAQTPRGPTDRQKGQHTMDYVRALKANALLIGATAVACVIFFVMYERTPPYTFNPFCTYDLTYRLNVTIEADGQQYSSEVVRQLSRSQKWVGTINSGCQQTRGTALSFRLADNRVVLISSLICPKAQRAFDDTPQKYPGSFAQAMREHRTVDLTSLCVSLHRDRSPSIGGYFAYLGYGAFMIDVADSPSRWKGLNFDDAWSNAEERLRIISAFAEAADISPQDELDRVAPALLKTTYRYDD